MPLADVMLFGHEQRGRWLLNIGGMANVTWVPRRGVPEGAFAFDTGPGVAVIDAITRRVDPDARAGRRRRRTSRRPLFAYTPSGNGPSASCSIPVLQFHISISRQSPRAKSQRNRQPPLFRTVYEKHGRKWRHPIAFRRE